MIELCGEPISKTDAWWLVGELRRSGSADDVTAAAMIEIGLTEGRDDIELFSHERDAVLKTLNDSPQRLIDLRYALDRDHRDRH